MAHFKTRIPKNRAKIIIMRLTIAPWHHAFFHISGCMFYHANTQEHRKDLKRLCRYEIV